MNAFPADAGPHERACERWTSILQQYAAATGLVVSLYDEQLDRLVGPLVASRLAGELSESRLWMQDGSGTRFERQLAARSLENGKLESDTFCSELNVRAFPVKLFGQTRGAIVFGWTFIGFPSMLGSDRLAREAGLSPSRLWSVVRLQAPVSPARMEIYSGLLDTLARSNIHYTEVIEELEALAEMREVFLAQVSHDLRTPLSALALRIETLLLGPLDNPESIRAVLKDMKASVKEQGRLIEDLVDAARTRTGQFTLTLEEIQLVHVIKAAVAEIRPLADRKGITLQIIGMGTDIPTPLRGDGSRLQQVFWNLFSNAVKFTPATGTVTIELRPGDDSYEVVVSDTGIGIDERLLPKLFNTFVKRELHNRQGLGLGLSIVKHIIELHGGSVGAFSEGAGKGARFTVILPRKAHGSAVRQT